MSHASSATPFGRYVLEKRIGRGGMAEVFTARYQAAAGVTKRVVVKKILPHRSDDAEFVKMFISEAKITASLSHGNLVQVFDFGVVDDSYFLAMEYVEGVTLGKLLHRAEDAGLFVLPAPYAVSILMEACKGLHYAHTRTDERGRPLGIVHRDVTPENILISYEGQVKVADFGVAKASVAGRSETEPGVVKGKLLYLSPEQARGEKVDARTDVFALGVVLFRMLCGSHPFGGSDLNVMNQIAHGGGDAPSTLNPELDAELEQIVLKAMSRDLKVRYPSAQALLQALSTWLNRHAPTHPPDGLANLVGWLYQAELTAMSRPMKLPAAFLEMVPLWQQVQVKHSAKRPNQKTTPLRSPSGGMPRAEVPAREGQADRGETAPLPLKKGGLWPLIAAVGVAALLAIGGAVFVATRPTTMTARIESDPAGAKVTIDGFEAPGVSPIEAQLSPGVVHQIVVTREGFKSWEGTVTGEAGELRPVWASLAKVQLEKPPEEQPPPPKIAPVVAANPFDVDGVPARFTLTRTRTAWDPKTEKTQTIELPPGQWLFHGTGDFLIDYEVPAPKGEGALRTEGLQARVMSRRLFYAWYQPDKSDAVEVGIIEAQERGGAKAPTYTTISGPGRVKLFTLMEDGGTGGRMSFLSTGMNQKTKTTIGPTVQTVGVPFARPVLREKRARVRALDPAKEHTVTVKAPKGQGAAAVICAFGREGRDEVPRWQKTDQMQLLIAPATFRFAEASTAWCTMLDLGPGSAEQVVVEIK